MGTLTSLARIGVNAVKHALGRGPEAEVSLRWLLRTTRVLNSRFRARAEVSCRLEGDYKIFTVNDQVFVWPKAAPLEGLIQVCSEQMTQNHPHQYLWGPTQLQPGEVALDIGACEGAFAAQAAALGARVIAIEPSQIMITAMVRLFQLRGLAPIHISRCLLGRSGSAFFLERRDGPHASGTVDGPQDGAFEVPALTLDEYAEGIGLQRLDFIKCDAEGADVGIIKSGPATLRRFRPKLAIATYHNDQDFLELRQFLVPLGYKVRGKGLLTHSRTKLRVAMLHAWC